jgi:hypothetical protein
MYIELVALVGNMIGGYGSTLEQDFDRFQNLQLLLCHYDWSS